MCLCRSYAPAISFVVYFSLLYFSAKALEYTLRRYSTVFPSLSPANQRSSVIYVMNIVFTTIALAYQLAASPVLGEEYSVARFNYIYFACAIVSGLYLFELTYRDQMRWPMITHHLSVSREIKERGEISCLTSDAPSTPCRRFSPSPS